MQAILTGPAPPGALPPGDAAEGSASQANQWEAKVVSHGLSPSTSEVSLSELASRVGEEMIVKRVYSVYGQYCHETTCKSGIIEVPDTAKTESR